MAKASQKHRKSPKRLNPSNFKLVYATDADASRYVAAFSRLVYSYEVIKDKKNTQHVRQIESQNLEVRRLAREMDTVTEEDFFELMSCNVQIFFLVKDYLDCGFAIVKFKDSETAYISDLAVFRHLIGMGTLLYNMLENHLKNLGITKVTLMAPFEGCKPFWRKMGFIPDTEGSTTYHKFL